jgi:hypothetical protein
MASWLLPFLIFGAWVLAVFAGGARKQCDGAARGLPPCERGGVSWLPIVPLAPLFFWCAALLVDTDFSPWGTVAVGSLHAVMATTNAVWLALDLRRLRALDKQA